MATSARRDASVSAARSDTRSRSTATSIRRPSDWASRSIALGSQVTSLVRYSHALLARVCSGTVISPSAAAGTGSSTTRARPAAVASATRLPMLSSCVPMLSPARIAEAISATSLASRSRSAASRARLSASAARSRATAASRPTTTAAISSTISSTRSCEWAIARRWRGTMKKKLSVSTPRTAVTSAATCPRRIAISSTASRYRLPSPAASDVVDSRAATPAVAAPTTIRISAAVAAPPRRASLSGGRAWCAA